MAPSGLTYGFTLQLSSRSLSLHSSQSLPSGRLVVEPPMLLGHFEQLVHQ